MSPKIKILNFVGQVGSTSKNDKANVTNYSELQFNSH